MKEKNEKVEEVAVERASLPVPVLNNVLQYLATKPFAEVAELIKLIQTESEQVK